MNSAKKGLEKKEGRRVKAESFAGKLQKNITFPTLEMEERVGLEKDILYQRRGCVRRVLAIRFDFNKEEKE